MHYKKFSLNGTYEMAYSESAYTGTLMPDANLSVTDLDMPDARFDTIENCVPGYWEDMTENFSVAQFYRRLRINPSFGIWKYPIAEYCPDMALPNIVGNFIYRRTFTWEGGDMPTELRFGGVQNAVSAWINGVYLGRHEGYSSPFGFEIPDGTVNEGENTVVLSVSNTTLEGWDGQPVSGLTNRASCECTGGIYGDVELRVYTSQVKSAAVTVSKDCGTVTVKPELSGECEFGWTVKDGETVVLSGTAQGEFSFDASTLDKWSPESPKLYTLVLTSGEAELTQRFGVRALTVNGYGFRLNGKPYYLRGICEHCYYPDTVNPWQDVKKYRAVIKKLKSLGFNYIRFHTHVPLDEYLTAADELGMIMHVESPNNASLAEWYDIVRFARNHTSALIYCCGNELMMDEPYIAHQEKCAEAVHTLTDALFSPLSAMRGLEYMLNAPDIQTELKNEPFKHHPRRFETVGKFADMYSSYALGHHSYSSATGDAELVDSWAPVYKKPRVSHEICIHGTYVDIGLKDRVKSSRIHLSRMYESIEEHLTNVGLIDRAPLYFANSVEWQRRLRKHCFENVRRSKTFAGYDFLGPIDTHWHTFGYDCGMMNEFYELKGSETERNVLMYNSPTVILTDLGTRSNFYAGERLEFNLSVSHFGDADLTDADLDLRLTANGKLIASRKVSVNAENGKVTQICGFSEALPKSEKPYAMKLYVTLSGGDTYAENEWELYAFPRTQLPDKGDILVSSDMTENDLITALDNGRDVLILGGAPFNTVPTSFRMALAGRPNGNLATVIADHPLADRIPNDGFCSWQLAPLMDDGKAVVFKDANVPFEPIIEVVSGHKNAVRQAALFEYSALNGRLLVCSFDTVKDEPASSFVRAELIRYMQSGDFEPEHHITEAELRSLINVKVKLSSGNTNLAFNANDKTATRKKR